MSTRPRRPSRSNRRSEAAAPVPRPAPGPGKTDLRVVLGVSGGIAAYKAAEIIRELAGRGAEVHVIMTEHARQFITPLTLMTLSGHRVLSDPWDLTQGADIQHISLARDLDLLIVAPATANILAKFAHGVADDFLSTFYLAVTAPVVVAPAMNVWMWEHPATRANLETLRARGVHIVDPEAGELACGVEGMGRMAEPAAIAARALEHAKKKADRASLAAASS